MFEEYRIIDADSHVWEPMEMWQHYLEPAFRRFALLPDMTIAGEKIWFQVSDEAAALWSRTVDANYPEAGLAGFDSESHVRAMKQMGVDISWMYPSHTLWILAIDTMPVPLVGAFVRAYNNWLKDFCSYDPDILRGVGVVNFHAPEEMVSELRRFADFGWKAVFLRPNPVKGRLLKDPAYEPFWRECEELDIAIGIHEGTHSRLPTIGADRFQSHFAQHASSHPMEQMLGLLALIEGGVLERHPKLRVAFLESGCGWLPYWLWRLDEEYERLHWEIAENVKMKPSEYFRRQCFIAIEPSEPYLAETIQYIGTDNLLFGSDYPHGDHKPDLIKEVITLEEKLSKEVVRKILWDNPARFYGIES
ncbi:MAG: amidohydrolase family protein [Cyanobacteria bacterium P01_E01_bin.42]